MEKMSVIVYAATGHVLGAFTRAIDPEGTLTADQVVGAALLVRDPESGNDIAHVEPQHLAIALVDRRDDLLLLHRRYVLADGVPAEQAVLTSAPPIEHANGTLTITLDRAPADDAIVWVQLEDGVSQPIVVSVEVSAAAKTGSALVTLTPNVSYNALVLAPGYQPLTASLLPA
jgi:hypothetical protein